MLKQPSGCDNDKNIHYDILETKKYGIALWTHTHTHTRALKDTIFVLFMVTWNTYPHIFFFARIVRALYNSSAPLPSAMHCLNWALLFSLHNCLASVHVVGSSGFALLHSSNADLHTILRCFLPCWHAPPFPALCAEIMVSAHNAVNRNRMFVFSSYTLISPNFTIDVPYYDEKFVWNRMRLRKIKIFFSKTKLSKICCN